MIGEGKRVCPDCERVYLEEETDGEVDSVFRDDISGVTDPLGHSVKVIERPPSLEPYELPADSKIRIDFDDGETLAFSYGIQIPLIIRCVAGGFLTIFCCFWYGIVGTFIVMAVGGNDPIAIKIGVTAFASIFLFAGLMPLGMLLTLFFGRAGIRMSHETVTGAIGFLFLKKKKSISTESISDVGLATTTLSSRRMRTARLQNSSRTMNTFAGQKGCMIVSSEFNMPLTMSADAPFNEQVAGLARFQLERLGVKLAND
jgi:hypothetical protein